MMYFISTVITTAPVPSYRLKQDLQNDSKCIKVDNKKKF